MCGMSKPDGETSWRLTGIVSGDVVNGHGGQQSQRVSRKIRGQKGNRGQVGYIYLQAETLYPRRCISHRLHNLALLAILSKSLLNKTVKQNTTIQNF